MSDRVNGLTVILDKDYRDDDIACIADAIRMIRGVKDVSTVITNGSECIAVQRREIEIAEKLGLFARDELLR